MTTVTRISNETAYIFLCSLDDGLIRAETCREYRSYLIKTLSIVAKQKVLLFTVKLKGA
jgi:hypothetical protein